MRRPTCSMSLLLGMAMLACFHANAGEMLPGGAVEPPTPRSCLTNMRPSTMIFIGSIKMARILTRSGCLCQFNGVFYW